MTDPLAPDLERIKHEVAEEATRAVSLFWLSEARKIEEQIDDPAARWAILLDALGQIGGKP